VAAKKTLQKPGILTCKKHTSKLLQIDHSLELSI